jgi:cytochrome c-type biogenesis protein CcmE
MTDPIDSGGDADSHGFASGDLDLTPRPARDQPGSRRRWLPAAVIVLVIAALGFILVRTLDGAALFFYNADEAIERRADLTDERFRVQGTPFGNPITVEIERDGRQQVAVVFPIAFDGQVIDVVHSGSPAELFQPGVPVVLEGSWASEGLPAGIDSIEAGANDGWYFASTDMVVKHENDYRNDNGERIDDAERGGFSPEP